MKETENTANPTSRKKKLIYSIVIAVCALLLIAATILTVYFVTTGGHEIVEEPPIVNPDDQNPDDEQTGGKQPDDDEKPDDKQPDDDKKPDDDNKPTGGEKVAFVKPLEYTSCSVDYRDVYNNVSTDKWYRHMAIDFVAEEGTEVCAMADGTVVEISYEEILGNYIVLEHNDGITTLYRFVAPVGNLKVGDKVTQGQTIATVDKAFGTEYKDGTHLHLEMRQNGNYVDPKDYIDVTLEEK